MSLHPIVRRGVLVPVVAAILGGLIGFGVGRVTDARRWPDLRFTSQKWKAVAQDERYVFWKDIDRRHLFIGKTREEIVQMLGAPDSGSSDRDRLTYVIKDARGEYNMNFVYFLDIRFNDSGRVSEVGIGTD